MAETLRAMPTNLAGNAAGPLVHAV
jgi:hypothetical protein